MMDESAEAERKINFEPKMEGEYTSQMMDEKRTSGGDHRQSWKSKRVHKMVFGKEGMTYKRSTGADGRSEWQQFCVNLVSGQRFDALCMLVIIGNAVLIGWMADFQMQHLRDPFPMWASYT